MRPLRLEISPRAKGHLLRIRRWWGEHGRVDLFDAEFAAVCSLLGEHPEAGPAWEQSGYRRVLMPRTRRYVYYKVLWGEDLIRIAAISHNRRGRPPRL